MPDAVQPLTMTDKTVTFDIWLIELESLMTEWHRKYGNLPYELPLDKTPDAGNVLCWKDSFDDGMTPEEAFASDRQYWEE